MATENGRDLLWKPTNVKESTVKFWRDSGDSCLVNWVQGLVSVFPLVDMENPLSLNPLLCEAFSPSWLRFSLFSLTSINTLVTFQVFPTLRSGLTASRLLIQHHACFFFAFYPFSLGDQRDEERMKILSPAWVPGMLDRPLPHAFLRPPEAKDRVSLTGKRMKSGLTWSKTLKFDFTQTFSLTKLYIVLILWHLKPVFSWSHFWSRLLTLRIGCSLPHT